MHKFSWYKAKSVEDALSKVNSTVSDILGQRPKDSSAIFKAGGVDVMDLMKENLLSPSAIIDIREIPGMDQVEYVEKEGLKIGANALLGDLEANNTIKEKYHALYQAIEHAGTPQLRNMATIGGNLAQRTRCWYFRSLDHQCYRKGSGTCYAQKGENEFHAIMGNSTCASVHASSVATALMAFEASVIISDSEGGSREVSLDKFFVHPEDYSKNETILKSNEIIVQIVVPPVETTVKSYYIKHGARESHDWAIADVAVVTDMKSGTCKDARIVLGAAAPVPIHATKAAKALKGKKIDEGLAASAGEISMEGATPLHGNAYKVPIFKTIVKRAILKSV